MIVCIFVIFGLIEVKKTCSGNARPNLVSPDLWYNLNLRLDQSYVRLKLRGANLNLDENKMCPTPGLVETEWGQITSG